MFGLFKGIHLKVLKDLRWQLEFDEEFDTKPFLFSIGAIIMPLVVLYIASLKNKTAGNILFKLQLFSKGTIHMFVSRDKKWKKSNLRDPREVLNAKGGAAPQSKNIIFIRHGESEWNSIFNMGVKKIPSRLVKGWVRETAMLTTRDSIFYDANLNKEGVDQILELNKFLTNPANSNDEHVKVLNGEGESSVLVSSNLRRAIATAVIGLKHRLQRSEKLHILSNLQEITFNVDGMGLAEPNTSPELNSLYKHFWPGFDAKNVFDVSENMGTKPLSSNGLKRMMEFNEWVFSRSESTIIVAGGHSLYFQYFFRTFLPATTIHDAKSCKMQNGAAVAFELLRGNKSKHYCVKPDSIKPIFKGFAKKK